MPSPPPVVSRRRALLGTLALAMLGATATACGEAPPPPDLADLQSQLDRAHSDSQLAGDAAAAAKGGAAATLTVVASQRSDHARALSEEISRLTGEAAASTTSSTPSTSAAPAAPPTAKDVGAALKTSADSAAQLSARMSGYRAGLLGSIAASCTASSTVALAPQGGTP